MNNKELAESFTKLLTLRWSPVAVKLLKAGEAVPEGVSEPSTPLRHCQAKTYRHLRGVIQCPQSDSNRHCADFKSAASANWAMGASPDRRDMRHLTQGSSTTWPSWSA